MPVTREDHELWAAARVIAMHLDGRCAQCRPDGCRLYRWAAARLAWWEAQHGRPHPKGAAAWRTNQNPSTPDPQPGPSPSTGSEVAHHARQ